MDDEEPSFWLCLTHDVDRPFKTYQALYETIAERRLGPLGDLRPGRNPYWQFQAIRDLEADLGVRSAFYFLSARHLFFERSPRDWLRPRYWIEHLGRYDVTAPALRGVIRDLDAGGWEVGLHGSYDSYDDPKRLAVERAKLESVLGHSVQGGRQHYLNLDPPDSWCYHHEIGLSYDSTPGSSTEYGFQYGYRPFRPFENEFAVFPLTLMETALPSSGASVDTAAAWEACERLLAEAAENDAVMTVLWHPRYFSDDFPGYRDLYRRLVERALDMGAWVGPPGDLYPLLDTPGGPRTVATGGIRERDRDEPNETRVGTESGYP